MGITIDQVPCWIIVGGKSHIVMEARDPGTYTACGTLFWGHYPEPSARKKRKHNGRICAKCRAALENLDPHGSTDNPPPKAETSLPRCPVRPHR